jgi:hypothetical protein
MLLPPLLPAVRQESCFSQLALVELKNHEEQLQEDPAAKLSTVRQRMGKEGGKGAGLAGPLASTRS